MKVKLSAAVVLSLLSGATWAGSWVHDIQVIKIGTYQGASSHFVWFSVDIPECQAAATDIRVMNFRDDQPGGKALFATLTTALVSMRKVDVQAEGCNIFEVYLK